MGGRARSRPSPARRVLVLAGVAALVLFSTVAAGGYAAAAHFANSIPRIHVAHLDRAAGPGTGSSGGGETVLLTSQDRPEPAGSADQPPVPTGLIMLLHINANRRAGGIVSIPPTAIVRVPGHGPARIGNAVVFGGASLLVQTVEQVTGVRINHYARIDFAHVASVVDAVGGVDIRLPGTRAGLAAGPPAAEHLTGATAIGYARQPSLTEQGRVLRQQNLIRAVLQKIAGAHLLTDPATMFRVLDSLTTLLTVDSNFTGGQLESLAGELAGLGSSSGAFVTAPATPSGRSVRLDPAVSRQLWAAIRQDAIAGFAARHPATVTPEAVP
jgi:LCP family protein required for cell wall assembly